MTWLCLNEQRHSEHTKLSCQPPKLVLGFGDFNGSLECIECMRIIVTGAIETNVLRCRIAAVLITRGPMSHLLGTGGSKNFPYCETAYQEEN